MNPAAPGNPEKALEPWIARFQRRISPFLLPRVVPGTNQTIWYVLCDNPRETRSMQEMLQAFVGPSYSNFHGFHGQFAALAASDPIDRLCFEQFGHWVFRLPVVNAGDRRTVSRLLEILVAFREQHPRRQLDIIKPIGRLMRDLEMAILVREEQSAWEIYQQIRSRGRLSATNLAFLQVRILAGFEKWDEVLNLPKLNDLLQIRRPKRISEAIATAVYRRHLSHLELQNNPQAALDQARSLSQFQVLVRSTEGFRSRDAIKLALLLALCSEPPNHLRAEQLIEREDQAWCRAIAGRVQKPTDLSSQPRTLTPFDLAESHYNQGDFDSAFELYLTVPPGFRSVCRVLETGVEVDSIHAGEKAINYLSQATDEVRASVLARRNCNHQIEALTRLLAEHREGGLETIDSWESWFEFVDQSEDLGNAHAILEHGSREWLPHRPDMTSGDASQLAELIKKPRLGQSAEVVRNAAPVFIQVFLEEGPAKREHCPIHRALVELLIYDDAIGADDLAAVEQLLDVILTTAPSQDSENNDFTFAADVIDLLWSNSGSPRNLDWALSMLLES
jgi:hypothetical protein